MDFSIVFALFIAAFINAILPGPCVILTFGRTVRSGVRAGLLVTGGILVGDALLIGTAVATIYGFVAVAPAAFPAMKWLGVACLVALAVRSICTAGAPAAAAPAGRPTHDASGGFMVGLSSPYNLLFYGAVLPQALPAVGVNVTAALLTIAVTLAAIAVAQICVVAVAAGCHGLVGRRARWIDYVTAAALLMFAGAAASVPMAP